MPKCDHAEVTAGNHVSYFMVLYLNETGSLIVFHTWGRMAG